MNWAVAAPILVAIVAGLFAFLQARRADKSAQFTSALTAGVSTLVDQLQEERDGLKAERSELKVEVEQCKGQCRELESAVKVLERKVEELKRTIRDLDTEMDNKNAEIIRLKREVGEPL